MLALSACGVRAPALSQLEFPFPDLFPFIEQIVSAFGVERVAWGSDFTRTGGLFSYWDGTHYLAQMPGVSPDDLAWLYGKALRKALNWPSNPHVRSGPVNDRVQGV